MEDVTDIVSKINICFKKKLYFLNTCFHYGRDLGHYDSELLAHSGWDLVRSLRNTRRVGSWQWCSIISWGSHWRFCHLSLLPSCWAVLPQPLCILVSSRPSGMTWGHKNSWVEPGDPITSQTRSWILSLLPSPQCPSQPRLLLKNRFWTGSCFIDLPLHWVLNVMCVLSMETEWTF